MMIGIMLVDRVIYTLSSFKATEGSGEAGKVD
jgi:hypothetical protein